MHAYMAQYRETCPPKIIITHGNSFETVYTCNGNVTSTSPNVSEKKKLSMAMLLWEILFLCHMYRNK